MPIYEYRCGSCGHELEAMQKFSDPLLTQCPACSTDTLVKLVSAAGFQLKGGGWYATDFKGGAKGGGNGMVGGGNGTLFVGEKGVISCAGWGGAPRIFPMSLQESYKRPEPTIPRSKGHHRDWINACKGSLKTSCDFEYGGKMIEMMLLGLVAYRVGRKISYDGAAGRVTDCPEANESLRRTYRQGWTLNG